MPLDVYIVDVPSRSELTGEPPAFQFNEAVHTEIFHGSGINIYSRFAYLRRMIDFYQDARYQSHEMEPLIAQIDALLPDLRNRAAEALAAFRNVCVEAQQEQKSLFLFCD